MSQAREMRTVRLVETTVLLLAGLLLAVATVYDVALNVRVNHRLQADVDTWRAYTERSYHHLAVDRELLGRDSSREVVCGNTSPGAPDSKTQLCLVIAGPQLHGRRQRAGRLVRGALRAGRAGQPLRLLR